MKLKKWTYLIFAFLITGILAAWTFENFNLNQGHTIGQEIDTFNGVAVFYNGGVHNVSGRNTTKDGYNLGLKYQCVEFVKRYYFEHLNHKMPDSYGHAKDFFNPALSDGQMSRSRNLNQYSNRSKFQPKVNDLLIFKGHILNRFGHVAIISKEKWEIKDEKILGWLRKN